MSQIFIAWSGNKPLALKLKKCIEKHEGYDAVVGGNDASNYMDMFVGTTIQKQMDSCDQAILLVRKKPENKTDKTAKEHEDQFSANLMFEWGYLLGQLIASDKAGNNKRIHIYFLDLKEKEAPSDLRGVWSHSVKVEGRDEDEVAEEIANVFFTDQVRKFSENKMAVIIDYNRTRNYILKHNAQPVFSNYEMAMYIILYIYSAYIFNGIRDNALNELTEFEKNLSSNAKKSPLLTGAADCAICALNFFKNIKYNEKQFTQNKQFMGKYIERSAFLTVKKNFEYILKETDKIKDGEVKTFLKLTVNNFLSYLPILRINSNETDDEAKLSLCINAIERSEETIRLCEEMAQNSPSDLNEEFCILIKAYMNRNMFLAFDCIEKLDKKVTQGSERLKEISGSQEILNKKTDYLGITLKLREELYHKYITRNVNSAFFANIEMEYHLSLAEAYVYENKDKKQELLEYIKEYTDKIKDVISEEQIVRQTILHLTETAEKNIQPEHTSSAGKTIAEIAETSSDDELFCADLYGREETDDTLKVEELDKNRTRAIESFRLLLDSHEQAVKRNRENANGEKYERPPLALLNDYQNGESVSADEIKRNINVIEVTLAQYKIKAEVTNAVVGPSVTRYDAEISDRTKIKNALRCRDMIAMALMKDNVAVFLNYSQGAVSIEVPNSKRQIIGLKDVILSAGFFGGGNSLKFALGKTVDGDAVCPEISKMPHLLVAGSTGSGKSVCINSLILSLIYRYSPEELRFILIDPKRVELSCYDKLPHLLIDEIIYDADKALKALDWAAAEMERRYSLFKQAADSGIPVRSLDDYNLSLKDRKDRLPKIVIIIDEFGDIMLQAKKEFESKLNRLLQKARASGIHLILATQRPSADCITGFIKSNMPTRIAFRVSTSIDSRVILDLDGAENLLGNGDMYLRSVGSPDLLRVQGCYVYSQEVENVISYVKAHNKARFDLGAKSFINAKGDNSVDREDPPEVFDDIYLKALKYCIITNQASVSFIQRRFAIGYLKSSKIIDWMENMNYISAPKGSKPRQIQLSLEEFHNIYGDVDD